MSWQQVAQEAISKAFVAFCIWQGVALVVGLRATQKNGGNR